MYFYSERRLRCRNREVYGAKFGLLFLVVSGRYVDVFARNGWVLNYSFGASSGSIGTVSLATQVVAGLMNVPRLENVDLMDMLFRK